MFIWMEEEERLVFYQTDIGLKHQLQMWALISHSSSLHFTLEEFAIQGDKTFMVQFVSVSPD